MQIKPLKPKTVRLVSILTFAFTVIFGVPAGACFAAAVLIELLLLRNPDFSLPRITFLRG